MFTSILHFAYAAVLRYYEELDRYQVQNQDG